MSSFVLSKRFSLLLTLTTYIEVRVCAQYSDMTSVGKMKAVQFQTGGADLLSIGDVPIPTLREKEVLMKVYASAINRADTLQRKGLYPPPAGESDILGLEASGVVEKLGPGCNKSFKIGDRVMALLPGGGNAEYVACREELLMPIPNEMDFIQAAAIPEVWLTAYQLLHFIANVEENDTVLIHAGGSGVGTAATQLCGLVNANVIVTAGSQDKINFVKSLGAKEGYNYKEGDFAPKVLEYTKGAGVDVILDCIGASYYEQNMNCIAMEGRWVLYGLMGGGNVNSDIFRKLLSKRVSIFGTTIRTRSVKYKESVVKAFVSHALPHFQSKKIQPIIDTVFPLSDIRKAHELMESNKNTGKIILKVADLDKEHDEL